MKNDPTSYFESHRKRMVESQLISRGIKDRRVLEAMLTVPRHLFVPHDLRENSYDDFPLLIGYEQTISQPYIVALMCEAASILPHHKVLEIGTGSGYQAAVLSHLSQRVYTIEKIPPLGIRAKRRLQALGYQNVHVAVGDGSYGWEDHAPYDAILVTASGKEVPTPLLDQLAPHGRLIMPLVEGANEELFCFTKTDKGFIKKSLGAVRFVPFITKHNTF